MAMSSLLYLLWTGLQDNDFETIKSRSISHYIGILSTVAKDAWVSLGVFYPWIRLQLAIGY